MKESPYFGNNNRSHHHRYRSSGSPYFECSPSSAFGTVRSLRGGWLSTLAPSSSDLELKSEDKVELKDLVLRHFLACSIFRSMWAKRETNSSSRRHQDELLVDTVSTLEVQLHRAVRHLCAHGCYLRAYAPLRHWFTLRQSVLGETALLSEASVDDLLQGGRCVLLPPQKNDDDIDEEKGDAASRHPNTVFHLHGRYFRNQRQVLDYLFGRGITSPSRGDDATLPTKKRKLFTPMLPPDQAAIAWHITTEKRARLQEEKEKEEGIEEEHEVTSPFGLLEELVADDPWKLLLCAILLNRTRREQVDVVLHRFLQQWPTTESVAQAPAAAIHPVVQPLGLGRRRAQGLVQFSQAYVQLMAVKQAERMTKGRESSAPVDARLRNLTRDEVLSLPQCGEYAYAAYRIFIQKQVDDLQCSDHALQTYAAYQRVTRARSRLAARTTVLPTSRPLPTPARVQTGLSEEWTNISNMRTPSSEADRQDSRADT